MTGTAALTIDVTASDIGKRLDAVVAGTIPERSRSEITALIRRERVVVNGELRKPSYRIREGDTIRVDIPPPRPLDHCHPEPIAIDILHEDTELIVINKQAGMVVHPAPGNRTGTLVNALLHHCPDLVGIGDVLRPGIVHRLDKDTTGVLVVAKTAPAHRHLSALFKSRNIRKHYMALVHGRPSATSGVIDRAIGRHPLDRKRMATTSRSAKRAVTLWRIKERFAGATLLDIEIRTGRTHQIRVHCAAEGFPVVGDPLYRRKPPRPSGGGGVLSSAGRQMLHARRLRLVHPQTGAEMTFTAPLPADMSSLLATLRTLEKAAGTEKSP